LPIFVAAAALLVGQGSMKDILPPHGLPQRRNLWQRARSLFMRWVLPKMKLKLIALLVSIGCVAFADGQTITDPAHIEVYTTPYYNSEGPAIDVGPFSSGLAAKKETEFVATIAKMKKSWDTLNFAETYVAAIRLYDLGFRKESIYWFYSAQYRGRLFASLIDREKMGSMGDPGFELYHAQNAFQQLVGPYVNGCAFGDIDQLVPIIERVQTEGKVVPDLTKIYPRVTFKPKSEWDAGNKGLNEGMTKLLMSLKNEKAIIKRQRIERGMEAKFSKMPSKDLPKGSGL
jgi:hypothetical protein